MVYITFIFNPLPCMSVSDKVLPPVDDFKIILVISGDCGFCVFAATPAEINEVAIFNPGLKKQFHIFSVRFKFFFHYFQIQILPIEIVKE